MERSRTTLGLETTDIHPLPNPEAQLEEVARHEFLARVRAAFEALEEAVRAGKIRRYGTATWNGYREDPSAPGYLSLAQLVAVARAVAGLDHHSKVFHLPSSLAIPAALPRSTQKA